VRVLYCQNNKFVSAQVVFRHARRDVRSLHSNTPVARLRYASYSCIISLVQRILESKMLRTVLLSFKCIWLHSYNGSTRCTETIRTGSCLYAKTSLSELWPFATLCLMLASSTHLKVREASNCAAIFRVHFVAILDRHTEWIEYVRSSRYSNTDAPIAELCYPRHSCQLSLVRRRSA
jgi:hypothetical protein